MFLPVTKDMSPELFADAKNKWRQIGKTYYQTDENNGITLEISQQKSGKFRWWLYDAKSSDPDMAVIESYDDAKYDQPDPTVADKTTIGEAMTALYEYLEGYQAGNISERLEYLRQELRAERMSYGELHELQSLAAHIPLDDVELLEAAAVPEQNGRTAKKKRKGKR